MGAGAAGAQDELDGLECEDIACVRVACPKAMLWISYALHFWRDI